MAVWGVAVWGVATWGVGRWALGVGRSGSGGAGRGRGAGGVWRVACGVGRAAGDVTSRSLRDPTAVSQRFHSGPTSVLQRSVLSERNRSGAHAAFRDDVAIASQSRRNHAAIPSQSRRNRVGNSNGLTTGCTFTSDISSDSNSRAIPQQSSRSPSRLATGCTSHSDLIAIPPQSRRNSTWLLTLTRILITTGCTSYSNISARAIPPQSSRNPNWLTTGCTSTSNISRDSAQGRQAARRAKMISCS